MLKSVHFIIILALLDLQFEGVTSNDDIDENAYPSYEYMQIFQSIPAFFEYLLNAVEEKPEILENNEAPVIKGTIEEDPVNEVFDEILEHSSYENNCEENEKVYIENRDIDKSKNIELNKYKVKDQIRDTSTLAYEYGNSIVKISSKEDTCEMKSKREVGRNENVVLTKDKNNANKNEESHVDSYPDGYYGWEKVHEYPGFQSLFSLDVTAEEIEQGLYKTEKLLEEYNNNRLAVNKGRE